MSKSIHIIDCSSGSHALDTHNTVNHYLNVCVLRLFPPTLYNKCTIVQIPRLLASYERAHCAWARDNYSVRIWLARLAIDGNTCGNSAALCDNSSEGPASAVYSCFSHIYGSLLQ